MTAYAFSFAALKGGEIKLADYAGKPILVVNTASQCGYTPQYAGLQELWKRYHERGLMIVGVPSNDFGGQEPGGAADITKTAHGEYGVGFPPQFDFRLWSRRRQNLHGQALREARAPALRGEFRD